MGNNFTYKGYATADIFAAVKGMYRLEPHQTRSLRIYLAPGKWIGSRSLQSRVDEQRGRCSRCHSVCQLEKNHRVPVSDVGRCTNYIENIDYMCKHCNLAVTDINSTPCLPEHILWYKIQSINISCMWKLRVQSAIIRTAFTIKLMVIAVASIIQTVKSVLVSEHQTIHSM